jgi:hypothetical protein
VLDRHRMKRIFEMLRGLFPQDESFCPDAVTFDPEHAEINDNFIAAKDGFRYFIEGGS